MWRVNYKKNTLEIYSFLLRFREKLQKKRENEKKFSFFIYSYYHFFNEDIVQSWLLAVIALHSVLPDRIAIKNYSDNIWCIAVTIRSLNCSLESISNISFFFL